MNDWDRSYITLMAASAKSPLWWLLPIALAIKLGYLFYALPDVSSVGALSIDALYHYNWASAIVSGDLMANAPYFRAPLYPYLLALLLKITGNNLLLVRMIQLLAGTVALIFAFRLAERLAGRMAALVAFVLLLLYPLTTYHEGELLLDSIFSLFALMSLYYLVASGKGRQRPLAGGLYFALAALTRPTVLVFLPMAMAYLIYQSVFPRKAKRRSYRPALIFLLVVTLSIAPVTILNYLSSGRLILVAYQGGVNFYIGNNPSADGLTSSLPPFGADWTGEDAAFAAYQATGRKLAVDEESSFWYRRGTAFIFTQPSQAIQLFVKKLYFAFSNQEVSNNQPLDDAVFRNPLLKWLPVRFSLIVALAIIPLILGRRSARRLLSLYAVVAIYGLVISLYFINSRFRMPLVYPLAALAGAGVASANEILRSRSVKPRFFYAIAAAAGVFMLTAFNPYGRIIAAPGEILFLRANAALRQADYPLAVARFDSLTRMAPYTNNSYLNLGVVYLKQGDPQRAENAFRNELTLNPASAEAANNIGVIFLLHKAYDSTLTYCAKALEIKPYYLEAAVNYLRAARYKGEPAIFAAGDIIRTRIRQYLADNPAFLFEEGLYLAAAGRYPEAIAAQLQVVAAIKSRKATIPFEPKYSAQRSTDPQTLLTLAHYQLGYLYGLIGDFDRSVGFSRGAIDLDPGLKEAYINLMSGLRSRGDFRQADSVRQRYHDRWPGDVSPARK